MCLWQCNSTDGRGCRGSQACAAEGGEEDMGMSVLEGYTGMCVPGGGKQSMWGHWHVLPMSGGVCCRHVGEGGTGMYYHVWRGCRCVLLRGEGCRGHRHVLTLCGW